MKTDLKSLKQQFVTKWIAKKSRKPFCSGSLPPAVNVKNVTYDKGKKRFYFRVSANKGILIDKNIQESVEIISREEALKLRELYFNSRSLSQNLQTSGSCYRTDTGERKKILRKILFKPPYTNYATNFQRPIVKLTLVLNVGKSILEKPVNNFCFFFLKRYLTFQKFVVC